MKTTRTSFATILLLLILTVSSSACFAQILSYTDDPGGSLDFVADNVTATGLSRVNGALPDATVCNTGFVTSNYSGTANYSSSLAAVEVSATPDAGFSLNVTNFFVDVNSSGNGPSNVRLAYSIDGGNTWITQGSDLTPHPGNCVKTSRFSWSNPCRLMLPQL